MAPLDELGADHYTQGRKKTNGELGVAGLRGKP